MDSPAEIIKTSALPRKFGHFSLLLLVVFAFLVAYPLGIGPAYRQIMHNPHSKISRILLRFYSPLDYHVRGSPKLQNALVAYIRWWCPELTSSDEE